MMRFELTFVSSFRATGGRRAAKTQRRLAFSVFQELEESLGTTASG